MQRQEDTFTNFKNLIKLGKRNRPEDNAFDEYKKVVDDVEDDYKEDQEHIKKIITANKAEIDDTRTKIQEERENLKKTSKKFYELIKSNESIKTIATLSNYPLQGNSIINIDQESQRKFITNNKLINYVLFLVSNIPEWETKNQDFFSGELDPLDTSPQVSYKDLRNDNTFSIPNDFNIKELTFLYKNNKGEDLRLKGTTFKTISTNNDSIKFSISNNSPPIQSFIRFYFENREYKAASRSSFSNDINVTPAEKDFRQNYNLRTIKANELLIDENDKLKTSYTFKDPIQKEFKFKKDTRGMTINPNYDSIKFSYFIFEDKSNIGETTKLKILVDRSDVFTKYFSNKDRATIGNHYISLIFPLETCIKWPSMLISSSSFWSYLFKDNLSKSNIEKMVIELYYLYQINPRLIKHLSKLPEILRKIRFAVVGNERELIKLLKDFLKLEKIFKEFSASKELLNAFMLEKTSLIGPQNIEKHNIGWELNFLTLVPSMEAITQKIKTLNKYAYDFVFDGKDLYYKIQENHSPNSTLMDSDIELDERNFLQSYLDTMGALEPFFAQNLFSETHMVYKLELNRTEAVTNVVKEISKKAKNKHDKEKKEEISNTIANSFHEARKLLGFLESSTLQNVPLGTLEVIKNLLNQLDEEEDRPMQASATLILASLGTLLAGINSNYAKNILTNAYYVYELLSPTEKKKFTENAEMYIRNLNLTEADKKVLNDNLNLLIKGSTLNIKVGDSTFQFNPSKREKTSSNPKPEPKKMVSSVKKAKK